MNHPRFSPTKTKLNVEISGSSGFMDCHLGSLKAGNLYFDSITAAFY